MWQTGTIHLLLWVLGVGGWGKLVLVCGVLALGGVTTVNADHLNSGCGCNSSIRGPSTILMEDTTVRSVRFTSGLLTVTETNTNAGGVPGSGYDRRNVIIFGAPNTGTGTIGRLIVTKLLVSGHGVVRNCR